jgi:hypothetical protein
MITISEWQLIGSYHLLNVPTLRVAKSEKAQFVTITHGAITTFQMG